MDCPQCGQASSPGDDFCRQCGGDLTAPPVQAPPAEEQSSRRFPPLVIAITATAFAVGVVLLVIAFAQSGDDEPAAASTTTSAGDPATTAAGVSGPGESPGEVFLEAAGSEGPDAFAAGELFAAPVVSTTAPLATPGEAAPPTAAPGQVVVAGRAGDQPGLYGGTRDNARCDAAGILAFLQTNPPQAEAWVAALNSDTTLLWGVDRTTVAVADLLGYFAELTPVILLDDTRVTNHGFRGGKPTPRQSVLQAGTAVLVDRFGVPRARCACGNPLTPPQPASTAPEYVGEGWDDFADTDLVTMQPATARDEFVLTDLDSSEPFVRPAGSDGTADADAGTLPSAVSVAVAGEYPPTDGVAIGAAYDSATFTVELDPAQLGWIALSGAAAPVDQPAGVGSDREPDGAIDVIFPNVDDHLIVEVSKDGAVSGPHVIHDRDAYGTPIGNQAVIYGHHPSVWYVSQIDWSTDPATSYTTTGPESGELTAFFDEQGAGVYEITVTFVNTWTGWVAHGEIFLLAGP